LSHHEYDNTIADLLGDTTRPARAFPEEGGSGFDNNADLATVTRLLAEKYMLAAEDIALRATSDLARLLPCAPATGQEAACVRRWIEAFGKRAWRRPLNVAEAAEMEDLFVKARADQDVAGAVRTVLLAFLQSPHFLYRVELSVPADPRSAVRLDGWELATRLSYFLWGTIPDDELLRAAESGALGAKEGVLAQAQRLLRDARARAMVRRFHEQWLSLRDVAELRKDAAAFPGFSPMVAASMAEELRRFVDYVYWDADGRFETLLTTPTSHHDPVLARFYGETTVAGPGFARVESPPGRRAGLLTQGAFLAAHAKPAETHPIDRGMFVREQILCQIPPPPPPTVSAMLPPPRPGVTARERLAQHRADPSCAGCHALIDPLGLALESFDAAGRFRATDGGKAIDPSGELSGTDVDGVFANAAGLVARLGRSQTAGECAIRQWFRFAHGRTESRTADACTMAVLARGFSAGRGNLRELLLAITQSDAFMYRSLAAGESAP
jgi:hypothetical protein